MRFFPREKGKMAFVEVCFVQKAISPFSRGKNRISQGVENRGSLISVPLALREVFLDLLPPLLLGKGFFVLGEREGGGVQLAMSAQGGQVQNGVNGKFAFACQHIVSRLSPSGRTGSCTVTQMRHPLLVKGL